MGRQTGRSSAISGQTRVCGIFGYPVGHSRSPALHNAAFAALELDWVYVAWPVEPAQLPAAMKAIRALSIAGVNLTVPHKERALRLLDSVHESASRTGAVNTIVNRDGHLHGANTDVHGFARSLREARLRIRNRTVLVIGAGGAARAVITALADAAAGTIRIANRTQRRGRSLVRSFAGAGGPRMETCTLEALCDPDVLSDCALVVNTTSIGWQGETFPLLAYDNAPRNCLFHDLVYGRSTDFLRRARNAGHPTRDGTAMLLHQAAAAFRLWTGRRAPIEPMRAVLDRPDR